MRSRSSGELVSYIGVEDLETPRADAAAVPLSVSSFSFEAITQAVRRHWQTSRERRAREEKCIPHL